MELREIEDGTFEAWEIELVAIDIEQVEALALHSPRSANAIV